MQPLTLWIILASVTGLACPVLMFFAIRRKRMGLVYLSLLALAVAVVCAGVIVVRVGERMYQEHKGPTLIHSPNVNTPESSQSDTLRSPAAIFFQNIYARRSDEFFPLGSDFAFRETYNSAGKLDWTLSFMPIDTLAKGEERYVRIYSDSTLQRIFPSLTLLLGVETCHWELSVNGLDFHGYVNDKDGDFVQDTTGYTVGFLSALGSGAVPLENDKRTMAHALFKFLNTGIRRNKASCLKSVRYEHVGDTLQVIHTYSGECVGKLWYVSNNDRTPANHEETLTIVFKNDRVVSIAIN